MDIEVEECTTNCVLTTRFIKYLLREKMKRSVHDLRGVKKRGSSVPTFRTVFRNQPQLLSEEGPRLFFEFFDDVTLLISWFPGHFPVPIAHGHHRKTGQFSPIPDTPRFEQIQIVVFTKSTLILRLKSLTSTKIKQRLYIKTNKITFSTRFNVKKK